MFSLYFALHDACFKLSNEFTYTTSIEKLTFVFEKSPYLAMDFTLKKYKHLLRTFKEQGYSFKRYTAYLQSFPIQDTASSNTKIIILRHDVEKNYQQALKFAQIQNEMGIRGTYYFRILPKCFKAKIVKQIADLGHEVGYHYDDLTAMKGDYEKAIQRFEKNLKILQAFAPVRTICMDGSPLSKYNNRDLWKTFSYQDYDILAEPYFNTDFNKTYYITDTGRMWDGHIFNVRDKATKEKPVTNPEFLKLKFHSTQDIIVGVQKGIFPNTAMLTFHPQRWNDALIPWLKELVFQNAKNQVKRFLVKK